MKNLLQKGAGMADYLVNDINFREASFNENIFSDFYEEYYEKVYNYVYFKTGERVNAEDLTCSIIEKVLNNIHWYNSAASSLNTWVFTIARNHLIDQFRSKSRSECYFEEGQELQISDRITARPEESVIETEQAEMISMLLQRLPETEREVMILKFWGGLKNIEIAAQLGLNSSNVNVMVFRTLKKLKKMMEEGK